MYAGMDGEVSQVGSFVNQKQLVSKNKSIANKVRLRATQRVWKQSDDYMRHKMFFVMRDVVQSVWRPQE